MRYKLIMLPDPIVVSNEPLQKIGENCYGVNINNNYIIDVHGAGSDDFHKKHPKVIAGIPELYSIIYSDEAEKTLKERCGWVDIEKLAEERFPEDGIHNNRYWKSLGFVKGYNYAQSLNNKKFTEEDIKIAMLYAMNKGIDIHNNTSSQGNDIIGDYIQSLKQPKVFDVEVEMEENQCDGCKRNIPITNNVHKDDQTFGIGCTKHLYNKPKITNNSIKLTKVI